MIRMPVICSCVKAFKAATAFRTSVKGAFDLAGFYNVSGFDRYEFVRTKGDKDHMEKKLFVMLPSDVPTSAHVLKTISLLNGTPALVIYD